MAASRNELSNCSGRKEILEESFTFEYETGTLGSKNLSSLGPSMSLDSRNSEKDSGISDQLEEEENELFENKVGLSHDMRFLAGMPELCDVMFLVGEERTPLFGVKAVLAIRSRVFYKMLFGPKSIPGNKNKYTIHGGTMARGSMEGTVAKRLHKMFSDASSSKNHHVIKQQSSGSNQRTVVVIDEFEADVFKLLLEYVHTGSVILHARTLLGLINAADHFALDDLRKACACFSHRCIRVDTVCSLLVTAEKYIQYKSTKIFLQRVLEFVDSHGEQVLRLSEFVHLPRHVVELVLTREDLSASEITKFRATERWIRHYRLYHPQETLTDLMQPFLHYIAFQHIPTSILMREVRPLAVVPDHMLMNALAIQADPLNEAPASLNAAAYASANGTGEWDNVRLERSLTIHGDSADAIHHERELSGGSSADFAAMLTDKQQNNSKINRERSKSVDRHFSMASGSTDGGYHEGSTSNSDEKSPCNSPSAPVKEKALIDNPYLNCKKLKMFQDGKRHSTTIVVGDEVDDEDDDDDNGSQQLVVPIPKPRQIVSDNGRQMTDNHEHNKNTHVKFVENTTIRVEYKL